MSPAGLGVEYSIGINNKFSLLCTDVNESSKTNKKPKTVKKQEIVVKKSEVNVKKLEVNSQKQDLPQKVQPKTEKLKPNQVVSKFSEKPKESVNETKKLDNDQTKQVTLNVDKRNSNDFKKVGNNDANKPRNNNKPKEEQAKIQKTKNSTVRIQTIVVESTKPAVESLETSTHLLEDVNKENHRRSNFNRKQARLDKGKDVFDNRGKRVYDRHSGQVKSNVKGSNIKREHLKELDSNQVTREEVNFNKEQNGEDSKQNKLFNDEKTIENEEVSKEISYAEYKKNLVLQGNADITKIYSCESKAQEINSYKNSDSIQTTDRSKKVLKVKKDKSTIDIEVESSIKTAESYIVKNPRPNNKNFRPNNFKNKQNNDRQKFNKEKKIGPTIAPPSLNLTDEFPSL